MSHDPELSDYLLGELDADGRARFEARMASDPALLAEVERLAPAVARLEALPEQAWQTHQATPLPATPVPGSGVRADHRRLPALPSLPKRAWAATALAAAALLGAGIGIGVLVDDTPDGSAPVVPTGPAIALAPLGQAPAAASAHARMTGPNRMLLTIRDLPPAPAGSYYEAWLLNDPDDLVPVASFSVGADGSAVVEVPLPAAADRYRFLDVSLQRVDGGTEHSADSVLRGTLS